jgi:hypothetical protein
VLPTSPAPSDARIWYEAFGAQHRSPLTGAEQRMRRWGMWRAIFNWENIEHTAVGELEAFFNSRGIDEEFLISNPVRMMPRARIGGAGRDGSGHWAYGSYAPEVKGASQTGRSLITDGWPASTLIFSKGDLIQLEDTGEVYQATADETSSAGGECTIDLGQYIRTSPADNEDVIINPAQFLVRLDRPATIAIIPPSIYSISAEMSESF